MRITVLGVSEWKRVDGVEGFGAGAAPRIVSNVEAIRGLKPSPLRARGTNVQTEERRRKKASSSCGEKDGRSRGLT